ncbi:hypothetical protein RZA67_16335 [Stenotrophomonas sp. C3(2023)]|uniref:hypothetical protein n=1 Tax=Stenotrophomonas sp. C3(2023) TaxID=3080277 RepID=UPI00293C646F|nr:hypothetical protein [Stenotrophomonas sp. C3(2023)]MDV3470284.1 hypothetical protein [Stenotrophomonas sp. C3(2023)]
MMSFLTRIAVLMAPIALTGCLIGNGRICGPQTPTAYCDKEAYQRLVHPTPLRDYWQHPSRPQAERQQDWIACGGDDVGSYSNPSAGSGAEVARRSSEKHHGIQRCMMAKGYVYEGACDTSVRMQYPACQARSR